MPDRALIAAGLAGAIAGTICCAAPILAVTLGTAGLMAWLAAGAYVLLPVLLLCLALIGLGSGAARRPPPALTRQLAERSENRERLLRGEGQRQGL
ncbi:MAG: hypothetical protein WBE80_06610 [Methylocella sp.]